MRVKFLCSLSSRCFDIFDGSSWRIESLQQKINSEDHATDPKNVNNFLKCVPKTIAARNLILNEIEQKLPFNHDNLPFGTGCYKIVFPKKFMEVQRSIMKEVTRTYLQGTILTTC